MTTLHVESGMLQSMKIFFANIALCGVASIKVFSNGSMSHGDIKPSNIYYVIIQRVTSLY
jgi:hypothetical protein